MYIFIFIVIKSFSNVPSKKKFKSLSAKKLRKIEKVFLIFPHNNYKMLDKTYFHVINSSFFHSPLNCTHISLITKRHFIFVILNLQQSFFFSIFSLLKASLSVNINHFYCVYQHRKLAYDGNFFLLYQIVNEKEKRKFMVERQKGNF